MDIDRLEQAVKIALEGEATSDRDQALNYCNEVRDSADGWKAALGLVADGTTTRLPGAVFFAYQILDKALPVLSQDDLKIVREKLWQVLVGLSAQNTQNTPPLVRNKVAQTLAFVFVLCYTNTWTSFFSDLQTLAASSPNATDIYLRTLQAIHEEIGDTLIIRDAETTQRNNVLKDQIRANDLAQLTSTWISILDKYSGSSDPKSIEVLDGTLKVIAGWVSWVDISLLLAQGTLIPLLFKQFAVSELRLTTLTTISEIVSKKMPPANKLELVVMLNLNHLLKELPTSNDEDLDFEERAARTVNIVALELERIMDSGGAPGSEAEQLLIDLMPTILRYFSNVYDYISLHVVPCINEYLQIVRKDTKKLMASVDTSALTKNKLGQYIDFPPSSTFITPARSSLLKIILEKIIEKSVYDPESEWDVSGDDESENEFLELREKLKVLQEQIASIDMDLFIDDVANFISVRLSQESNTWQETELALYELGVFGAIRGARDNESRASQILFKLFGVMIESNVVTINHPLVQLSYMEIVNRHANFFSNMDLSLLSKTLQVFVSPLGLHNQDLRVRVRSWYLFNRLYKTVRKRLDGITDVATIIFNSVSPLLRIEAQLPSEEDDTRNDASSDPVFTAQLYLFELCGMVFARGGESEAKLTHNFLEALFGDVNQFVDLANKSQGPDRELQYLKTHHAIMALGTFTRGMDDVASSSFKTSIAAREMRSAAEMVAAVLEQLGSVAKIREASRFTISRLVGLLGSDILMEVSRLINALLTNGTISELGDFLSFLGQLVHTFRNDAGVFEMFTSLTAPLFQQVFQSLQKAEADATTGSTDLLLIRKELVRSYLAYIFNLLNNRYGAVFLLENNRAAFENVLQSLVHYSSRPENDVSNQKMAIVDLARMVQLWGTGSVAPDQFGSGEPVALFDSPVVFTQLTEMCWTLTAKPEFSLKDAQHRLVVFELGALQKSMWEARGDWYSELVVKYLEKAGLPTATAQEFVVQMSQLAVKEFKRYFYDFLVRTQS